jgi:hypothetical protein
MTVGILTKQQIAAVDDLKAKIVRVEVPEWGGAVCLRPMTVRELDDYSNEVMRNKGNGLRDFRTRLVACSLCDEQGQRLFTDDEVDMLAAKSGAAMDRLYRACDEINDIGPKRMEDIAGNSSPGQPECSHSDSPGTSGATSATSSGCPSPSSASGGPTTST